MAKHPRYEVETKELLVNADTQDEAMEQAHLLLDNGAKWVWIYDNVAQEVIWDSHYDR